MSVPRDYLPDFVPNTGVPLACIEQDYVADGERMRNVISLMSMDDVKLVLRMCDEAIEGLKNRAIAKGRGL